jgi:hypothetical protein
MRVEPIINLGLREVRDAAIISPRSGVNGHDYNFPQYVTSM